MAIVRWEPLRELTTLQNEMNRLFGTVFDAPAQANGGTLRRWMPAMDLVETEEHFVLTRRPSRPRRGGRQHRGRGPRPHRLGRAQGRARARRRATTASSARSARSRAR